MDDGPGCKNEPDAAAVAARRIAGIGMPRAKDVPVDIRSMRELQSLGIVAQALGLVALIGAWAIAEPAYQYDLKVLGLLCALVSLGLIAMLFVKTPGRIFLLTTLTVSLLAEAFYRVASVSPSGHAWCLVIGIVFVLVMAPIFATVPQYVTALVVIALLLSRGEWIRLAPERDLGWNVLLLGAVAAMGIFLNFAFSNLRHAGYRQRLTLEAMAYQDALTGLDNRRSMMERLRALEHAGGLQQTCFLMVDIDDFKQINDSFGHDHGDAVLKALANAMRDHAAPHTTARLGGEEFGVLMETAGRQDAAALAERLLAAARGLARHPLQSAPADRAPLGISIGLACGRAGDRTGDLLRRSDEALYAAKRAGKNCCRADPEAATGPLPEPSAPLAPQPTAAA